MRILVTEQSTLNKCLEAIRNSSIICFDTETNGLRLWDGHHAVGVSFYTDFDSNSYYIPFAHGHGTFEQSTKTAANAKKAALTNERYHELQLVYDQIVPWKVWDGLKSVLTPDRVYLCHNAQFDLTALLQHGVDLTGATVYDSMLAARTLYSGFVAENKSGQATTFTWFKMPDTGKREKGTTGLKWLARLFGLVSIKRGFVGDEQALVEAMKDLRKMLGTGVLNLNIKKHLWALPPELVAPYACMDVELTYGLHEILLNHLDGWGQVDVYKLVCEHQMNIAWRMHQTGFKIDHERGDQLMADYETERGALLKGVDFNHNSANEIAAYALKHDVTLPMTPKGNPKTDKKTLKSFQNKLPLIKNILAVKALDKNVGTYIKKWLANTTPEKPLHSSFNVVGTVTGGRWTSDIQQVPKDTKLKYSPKKLLLPIDPDYQIVEIDYSQLEMRIGAWVAETLIGQGQDMTLTNMILDGVDMHAYTRDHAGVCDILLDGRSVEEFMEVELGHDMSQYKDAGDYYDAFMAHARQVSKVPNFAAMYAGGWQALTNILENITEGQARAIMEGWKEAYPTVVRAMTALTRDAMEWRYKPSVIETERTIDPQERERNIQPLYQYIQYPAECVPFIRKWSYYSESDKQEKSKDAFNSIVQGTAGFITIESINRVLKHYSCLKPPITPHATIHDSFVYSTHPDLLFHKKGIVEIMTNWPINPPLLCDVDISPIGASWGDKKEYLS